MKQLETYYWIAVVEAGDTMETIGHWVEDNLERPLDRGSVDTSAWVIEPKEGDLVIFNSPGVVCMLRYPDFVREIPAMLASPEREQVLVRAWTSRGFMDRLRVIWRKAKRA